MSQSGIVQLRSIVWIREVSTGDDSEVFVDENFMKSLTESAEHVRALPPVGRTALAPIA